MSSHTTCCRHPICSKHPIYTPALCCSVLSYRQCLAGWTRPPSLQDININFPSLSVWASQEINCYGLLPYVTNCQLHCAVCFCLIIYQMSCTIRVFINHKTCSSCTAAHQILYSALSTDIQWTADGRGGPVNWPTRSSANNVLCFWLLECVKFCVLLFNAANWLQAVRQFE